MRKSPLHLLTALLVTLLLVTSSGCNTTRQKEDSGVFSFQDAALEYAVREYLNQPDGDVMTEDIRILRIFSISPDQIQLNNGDRIPLPSHLTPVTLADLQAFPNTGSVLVSGGSYEGLDTLGGCVKLQKLGLNQIDNLEDISFLGELPRLVVLSLHSNQNLTDFSPLAGLEGLAHLDLHDCGLEDIAFLSGLTSLTKLVLHNNRIGDISVLANFPKLTDLDLHTNSVEDISVLSGLEKLENLRLEANLISDLSALSAKRTLKTLALDYNEVSSLLPLEYQPSLQQLKLNHNPGLSASQIADLRKTLPEDCKIEWN